MTGYKVTTVRVEKAMCCVKREKESPARFWSRRAFCFFLAKKISDNPICFDFFYQFSNYSSWV